MSGEHADSAIEAGLRRQKRVMRRALELVVGDLSGKVKRQVLAREVQTMRDTLDKAARLAYGSEWESQRERIVEVATWESSRVADEVEAR